MIREDQGVRADGPGVSPAPGAGAIPANQAEVALNLGQHEQAAASAREALRLGHDDARTRCVLALALLGLGRGGEAVAELRYALRMRPDFAATHELLGSALMAVGRLDEAQAALLEAIRINPGLPSAHARLGEIAFRQDRIDDAGRHLVRATQLDPRCAVYWELLAAVHECAEQSGAAIVCWERVLALTPDVRAHPHLALGWMLQEEGRLDEAEAHYRRAESLEPGVAETAYNQAGLDEERGAFAAAEAGFRTAIRRRPTFTLAHVRLATLLRDALPDPDLEALRSFIDDPATDEPARCRLRFALGHVLDARADRAGAVANWRLANAGHLATAPSFRRFNPVDHARFVDEIIGACDREFFARVAGAGLATRLPVFVVGLPRSGTSLLEQILASHPLVHGAGELPLARRMFEYLPVALGCAASSTDCLSRLDRGTIRRLAGSYLDRLVARSGGRGERVVDKMADLVSYVGLLAVMFPQATVIHCRRDLRDVALSCWQADFRSLTWTSDPGHIAAMFRAHLRLMDHWRTVLPLPIHEVDYEEVVSDLEGVARRLLAALGLAWDPACLEFHRTQRPVRTTSVAQVRQPLYTRSIGRWRRYADLVPELFAALPAEPDRTG